MALLGHIEYMLGYTEAPKLRRFFKQYFQMFHAKDGEQPPIIHTY